VIRPFYNQSVQPQVGVTRVNVTAGSPLYG